MGVHKALWSLKIEQCKEERAITLNSFETKARQ